MPIILKNLGNGNEGQRTKMLPQADWQGAETLSDPGVHTDGYVGIPEYFQFPNRTISKWGFKVYFIMMTNVSPFSLHTVTASVN